MNIAIVASKYLPAVGGLEIAVNNLAKEFKTSGHNVLIITNRYSRTLKRKEVLNGIEVYRFFFVDRLPTLQFKYILKYCVMLLFVPQAFFGTWRILKKHNVEIVNFHFVGSPALYVYLLSKVLNFRLIVSLHGADVETDPYLSKWRRFVFTKVMQRADAAVANSSYLANKACEFITGEASKIQIIPMGVDIDLFRNARTYEHQKKYLLFAGRLVRDKGCDILIRSFAQLVNEGYMGDLIIAGDGEESETCKRLAEELLIHDRIIFLGLVNHEQIVSLMLGCDVFVAPSRREAYGIVLVEALVAGKPIVASRVGGIPEIIENGKSGILVEPDNIGELTEAIKAAVNNPHCSQMSGDDFVTRYSWPFVGERYLELFRTSRMLIT